MYCLRVKILTLVTIGYIVCFIVGMYFEYCLWAQVAILDMYCIYWTVWDRYMQVLFLGRAPRTKETLLDFLKWRRVTRSPLVFHGLTGSQRTPGFWGITATSPIGSESAPHFNMSLWSWVRALTEAKEKVMGHAPIACEWDHPSSEWARGWGPYKKKGAFFCKGPTPWPTPTRGGPTHRL